MEDTCRDTTAISNCIRGYHAYKDIWNPSVGDKVECRQEPTNVQDRYAVAFVYKRCTDVDDDLDDDTSGTPTTKNLLCVLTLHSTWQEYYV